MKRIALVAIVLSFLLMSVTSGLARMADQSCPAIGTAEGISYMSGGFGEDERKELKSKEMDYNTKFVFSLNTGHMVGKVDVLIKQNGKTLLDDTSPGPWLYLDMVKGSYTIEAIYEGISKTKSFSVPSQGMRMVHVTWSADETGFSEME